MSFAKVDAERKTDGYRDYRPIRSIAIVLWMHSSIEAFGPRKSHGAR